MKKYEYILIDLDDTIFDFKKGERASIINTMNDIGYRMVDDDINTFSMINEKYFQMYANGELSRDEFHHKRFEDFFLYLGLNNDPDTSDRMYMNELSMACEYVDGAVDFLNKINEKYKLYIASNGMYDIQISRLKKAGIYDMFDGVYVSSKIGANKPSKDFFEYIFKDLNDYDKSKYLIIGDREDSDILGGIDSGIDTMYFNRKYKEIKLSPTYVINKLCEFDLNKLEK